MIKEIVKSSGVVGACTILGRSFGYIREVLMAAWLGASSASDALTMAIKIPALLRRITSEGALNSILVPILHKIEKDGKEKTIPSLITDVGIMMFFIFLVIFGISYFFPKIYISIVAPGFFKTPERVEWFLAFSPYITATIIFFFLSSLFAAVLNANKNFVWPAIAPAFCNIVIVLLMAWAMSWELSIFLIAPFFLIGSFFQMLGVFFPFLKFKIPFSPKSCQDSKKEIKIFYSKLLPVVLSSSISQLTSFLTLFLSSYLPQGITTLMHRSERFFQLPLSIAAALTTPLLPELSKAEGNKVKLRFVSIGLISLIFIPFTFVLLFYAEFIIKIFFSYGKSSPEDVKIMVNLTKIYAIGIPPYLMLKVVTLFFFAEGDVKIPARGAILHAVLDAILSLFFIFIKPLGGEGLVLSSVLSAWMHLAYLFWHIHLNGWLYKEKQN